MQTLAYKMENCFFDGEENFEYSFVQQKSNNRFFHFNFFFLYREMGVGLFILAYSH